MMFYGCLVLFLVIFGAMLDTFVLSSAQVSEEAQQLHSATNIEINYDENIQARSDGVGWWWLFFSEERVG